MFILVFLPTAVTIANIGYKIINAMRNPDDVSLKIFNLNTSYVISIISYISIYQATFTVIHISALTI